jgi:hypothetical protein
MNRPVVKTEAGLQKNPPTPSTTKRNDSNSSDLCMVTGTIGHCLKVFAENQGYNLPQLLFVTSGVFAENSLHQEGAKMSFVLKDPTGNLDCFYFAMDGLQTPLQEASASTRPVPLRVVGRLLRSKTQTAITSMQVLKVTIKSK